MLSIVLYSSSFGYLFLGAAAWMWFLDWCKGASYTSNVRLDGKLAVVTGANVGIGKAVAIGLVNRGARVILACRDEKRAAGARADILRETGAEETKVEFMKIDLASFQSVRYWKLKYPLKIFTVFQKLCHRVVQERDIS